MSRRIMVVAIVATLLVSAVGPAGFAGVALAQQSQTQGPPDHAAVGSVDVRGGSGPPSQAAAWGVSSSSHGADMSATVRMDGDRIEQLVVSDDLNDEGREVSVDASMLTESTPGDRPQTAWGTHESGERWVSEISYEDGYAVVDVPHFSTNTIEFTGSYSLSANGSEDGDSFSYALDDGDVEDVNLTLTGNTSMLDQSQTTTNQDGDTIPVDVDGTESTDVQITLDGSASGWSTQTPLSTTRSTTAGAAIGDDVYVVGGNDGSNFAATVERYNSSTNSVTTLSPLPTGRDRSAAASIDGELYVAGGYDGSLLDTLERYDPANDTWEPLTPMPTPRNRLGAAAIDGKLYAVGGTDGTELSTLERYDPSTDSWTSLSPMPTARAAIGVTAYNGSLYVIGGNGGPSIVERYDPSTDSWTSLSNMQVGRSALSATEMGGEIYALGGDSSPTVERYDPSTDSWQTVSDMPRSKEEFVAASVDGQIITAAGKNNGGYLDDIDTYSDAISDPAVTLGGSTVSHDGTLSAGESEIGTVTLSPGSYSADVGINSSGSVTVGMTWTERTTTTNPTIDINGNTVSHTGSLADGETVDLSSAVDGSYLNGTDQTLNVSVSPSISSPAGRVDIDWSHTAVDQQSVDYDSETWTERYNVSKTWGASADNAELRIPWASDRIIGIEDVDLYYNDGGTWTESTPSYSWSDGGDLVVEIGSVAAGDQYRVDANGTKIQVVSGSISVTDPTIEGSTLDTEFRIDNDSGTDPVEIDVGGTVDGELLHYLSSSDWTADDYARFDSTGSQTLVLPEAVAGATARVNTAPISAELSSGDAIVDLDNVDEPRFSVEPGSSTGDSLTIGYTDTTSGEEYVLRDVSTDDTVGPETANSPVYFDIPDASTTWVAEIYDGGGTAESGGGLGPTTVDSDGLIPTGQLLAIIAVLGLGLASGTYFRGRDGFGTLRRVGSASRSRLSSSVPVIGGGLGWLLSGSLSLLATAGSGVVGLLGWLRDQPAVSLGLSVAAFGAALVSGVIPVPEGTVPAVFAVGVPLVTFLLLQRVDRFSIPVWGAITAISLIVGLVWIGVDFGSALGGLITEETSLIIAAGALFIAYQAVQAYREGNITQFVVGGRRGGDNQ